VEGGLTGAALFGVGDGSSGGVVVVAELFAAKAGAGTAASVGEDVAALEAFGFVHGVPPPRGFLAKVFGILGLWVDLWVKKRKPGLGRASAFLGCFYFIWWGQVGAPWDSSLLERVLWGWGLDRLFALAGGGSLREYATATIGAIADSSVPLRDDKQKGEQQQRQMQGQQQRRRPTARTAATA
jgi:hypothetical protein